MREAATRSRSQNNLKQIGWAMHSYAEKHDGRFPPAALRDSEGRPLLSWRVLLLPYLEEGKLYEEFHLDEAWDSPHNLALLRRMPDVYGSPLTTPPDTYYQVIIGPDTPFEIVAGPRLPYDFGGKTSGTILVAEAGQAVPWTKPQDLEYAPDKPLPALGGHFRGPGRFRVLPSSRVKGLNVLLADGSARFVAASMPEHAWRWAISRTTTEPMPREW